VSSLLTSSLGDASPYLFNQFFIGDFWVAAPYSVGADSGDCICHIHGEDDFLFGGQFRGFHGISLCGFFFMDWSPYYAYWINRQGSFCVCVKFSGEYRKYYLEYNGNGRAQLKATP